MKVIYKYREYHSAMIHFLDDLACNGPGGDMPTRPKGDLASLLGNKKPSNKLCGVELHKYLIKSLLCAEVFNQPGFARDGFYTDFDQISPHLVGCYEQVKKQNTVGICPRYSQKLREVAKLLQNYSRFQNVGISFSEIYQRREQITKLLHTNSIAACY